MAKSGGACLHKQARLNIEPAFPGSTISFTLPAETTSTFGTRTQPRRKIVTEQHTGQDEEAFARQYLAKDGGLFFRRHHQYPRSFLWRILDDRKALEIQSVDQEQDARHEHEANLTLILHFASPIRPFCVAFAEPEDRDALIVFAVTDANELYTITLHRDFFIKQAASELEISDWCKRSSLTAFILRTAYRLAAPSSNELLMTLDNGATLYLTREHKDDVAWKEAIYEQKSWTGQLRGYISWKQSNKVQFHGVDLEALAAAAVAFSPDRKHILTVCLDHKIRSWNLSTGKLGFQKDLLGEPDRPNDKTPPYLIDSSQAKLMEVINLPGQSEGSYHVVTYSPKQHQFKFWSVIDADEPEQGLYDAKPDVNLIPPIDSLMNTSVWTLEEFFVSPGPAWRGTELWIRARSGPSSRIYHLQFNLMDDDNDLAATWEKDWTVVDSGPLSIEGLRRDPSNPGEWDLETLDLFETDIMQAWLEFLFYPGRFTPATLETAFTVYRKGFERGRNASTPPRGSLKERICAAISNTATTEREGKADQLEFEKAAAAQWQIFYGLVKDLHKRRGAYLSLEVDLQFGVPWIVMSDYLTAIRECAASEVIAMNASALLDFKKLPKPLRKTLQAPSRQAVRLLVAAASFRKSLPTAFQTRLHREVHNEVVQNRSLAVEDRMELIEQDCDLLQQVSDDDVTTLVEELGMAVKEVTKDTFLDAFSTLGEEEDGRRRSLQITHFGLQALTTVAQETLETNYNVLLDLLALVLFMQFEEDVDDFDAPTIFVEIIDALKDCTAVMWLARTVWSSYSPTSNSSNKTMQHLDDTERKYREASTTQTVLEGILGHRSFEMLFPKTLQTRQLTYWSRLWIKLFFKDTSFDAAMDDIMGVLLMQKQYVLAQRFSSFLSEDNWATYLKGRMHLALGDYDLASNYFQKAASNLGKDPYKLRAQLSKLIKHPALGMFSLADADQINFIPPDQQDSFSEGLGNYYHHIVMLFEKHKAYSFVADFARLGLRSINGRPAEDADSDLLLRLFTASIQTQRFDDAYSAMIRQQNPALKSASLQTLVTSMIQNSQTPSLLKFPFVGLVDEVDEILSTLCHRTLNLASGPQYHQLLYSFRIARHNFRGAASILYERLQRLKTTSSQVHDPADDSLTQCYLMIINTLSSVSSEEAYILADQRIDPSQQNLTLGEAKIRLKRQIITLDAIRKEYQAELDRVEAIESGQYPFVDGGDEMDIL